LSHKTLSAKGQKIAFYTLGVGLRDAYREKLSSSGEIRTSEERVRYEQRDGAWIGRDGTALKPFNENSIGRVFSADPKPVMSMRRC